MPNTTLYELTRSIPWSHVIKHRRINWLGHLLRLPEELPAKLAPWEYLRKTKRPPGKPKTTWMILLKKDLSPEEVDPHDLDHVTTLAND